MGYLHSWVKTRCAKTGGIYTIQYNMQFPHSRGVEMTGQLRLNYTCLGHMAYYICYGPYSDRTRTVCTVLCILIQPHHPRMVGPYGYTHEYSLTLICIGFDKQNKNDFILKYFKTHDNQKQYHYGVHIMPQWGFGKLTYV